MFEGVSEEGCIGCMTDVEAIGYGAIGVIDDAGVDISDGEEPNTEELKDVDGTRVAPNPGPGRLVDDLDTFGLSELGIFGDDGSDCVC